MRKLYILSFIVLTALFLVSSDLFAQAGRNANPAGIQAEMQREIAKQKAIAEGRPFSGNQAANASRNSSGIYGAFSFSGTLSLADPTFNRPLSMNQGGVCGLSGVGTAVHYKTHQFTLATTGNVTVSLLAVDGGSVTPGSADTFLGLYGPAGFIPASACTNLIAANDDASGLISRITTTTPLAPGVYTVVVTSFDNTPSDFPWNYTLAINTPDVAPCDNIPVITCGTPVTSAHSGSGAGWSITTCGFSTPGEEKIYSFTPTVTGTYSLQVTAVGVSGFIDYFYKAAAGGCTNSGWTCIDDVSSPSTATIGVLTAGIQYYILLDDETTAATTHTFQINCVVDPCTTITNIPACGTSVTTAHSGAGTWSPGNCGFATPGQERIYSFTPTVTGAYSLQVTGVPTSGFLDYFYKAASGGCSSTGWTCIDDINSTGTYPIGTLTAGTQYYILVDDETTGATTHNFNIVCLAPPPANDLCSGAITINCGQTITGSTTFATTDAVATCGTSLNTAPGVWYTFAGDGSLTTLSLCGSSYDTKIGVFSGSCGTFTCVAGNDDFCGTGSQVTFTAAIGTTYYVLVTGFSTNSGNYSLTRTCIFPCTGVPSPGFITPLTSSVCVGTSVTLTLNSFPIATGLTYQWKEATTPGGTYTNIPGATNTTYTFTAAATRYYVCTVTCTNPGGGSATTAEVVVNVGNPQHSSITATPNNNICSPGSSVITATATGGIGNYTHTLTGPGTIAAPVVSGANNANVSFSVTNIPAGVNTYTLTSTDALGCSKASTVTVTVNQTPLITLTTTPAVGPCLYTYAGPAVPIPDNSVAGVNIPITVNGLTGLITDLNFKLNANPAGTCDATAGNTNASVDHTWNGDLVFTLRSPAGTTVTLINQRGSSGNNFCNVVLDDDGGFPATSTMSTAGAINGNFAPENPLSAFDGQNGNGVWYLNVSDRAGGDLGFVRSFTLEFACNGNAPICNGNIVRIDANAAPPATQSFTNLNNTHIPAGGTTTGISSPYPNTLAVAGLPATGVSVKSVTLTNFSHTFPDDVDIVLVSPTGQSVILMSDAGGGTDATGQTFTLDDAAASFLSDGAFNATGNYKPTNYGAGDNWPAPGPGSSPSSVTLSSFTGNMNGNWSLYAFDDASSDFGIISTWTITFNVLQPLVFSPTTNLYTDAAATVAYTGTPAYTVWAKPAVTTTYTASTAIGGCSNSASVTINVNQLPAITTQPTAPAAPVCPGFNTTFTVAATGTGLTYQWQRSTDNGTTWNNIVDDALHSGTTTTAVTVINPTVAQNGHRYRVIVSGTCPPPVTSNVVTLVVATPPTITTQPANRTVCAPDAAVFTVVAGGTPAPNIYQWQVSTNGGGTWTNLTTGGSYTPTLTVSPTATSQTGSLYRVIVTNTCGQTVTSGNATLTVNAPTTVTITPLPSRICLSDTLVPLSASPVGGTWSGIGISGSNFIPGVTSVGSFTLTYTYVNAAGCTSTGTVVAPVIDCPERIRQLDDNAVVIFPNPNTGRFNIRINSTLYNYLGMSVHNTAGQLLHRQTFNGLSYGRVVPVDLSYLPAGAYMVKIFYDDGIRTSEKTFPVIIQRQ